MQCPPLMRGAKKCPPLISTIILQENHSLSFGYSQYSATRSGHQCVYCVQVTKICLFLATSIIVLGLYSIVKNN